MCQASVEPVYYISQTRSTRHAVNTEMMFKFGRSHRRLKWIVVVIITTILLIKVEPFWNNSVQDLKTERFAPTEDKLQISDKQLIEFQRRQKRFMGVCAKSNTGSVTGLYVHKPSGLVICAPPKVGCTFWKRIMTFLNSDKKRWKNPFEIDRYTAHFVHPVKIHYDFTSKYVQDIISNSTRAAFARDPYSRLWSAYVDKIILPDSWKDVGLGIYKYRQLGNSKCPHHITFEDFLHYAVYKRTNDHWAPLYKICNPCNFYPHYIGKMETFSQDASYVLKTAGLGYLLDNQNHHKHIEDEIALLTEYHFKVHANRKINQLCLTVTDLAGRLWRAFQLNGYLALNETFPVIRVNKSVEGASFIEAKGIVTKMFVEHYKRGKISSTDWKMRRNSVLVDAYGDIPLRLRKDISKKYERDFELFEYEKYPKNIFSEKDLIAIKKGQFH